MVAAAARKMGASGPGVPPSATFLLLLPLHFLMSMGSFLDSVQEPRGFQDPRWFQDPRGFQDPREFQHLSLSWRSRYSHLSQDGGSSHNRRSPGAWQPESQSQSGKNCLSSYDLYFIIDKSGSVNNNWMDIYQFVEGMVKKFENPKLRMSFITFSTFGETVMPLTADRKEIQKGLARLQRIVPAGATHMHEGFKRANEQIEKVNAGEHKVPSMIIALTDGTLMAGPFHETKMQAARSRKLGATVYCVGVFAYDKSQLVEIADSESQSFGVDGGFKNLKKIVDALTNMACIEVKSAQVSRVCLKENYELTIFGKAFLHNTRKKGEVICRFKFSEKKFFDKKATSVEDTSIKCPGVTVEQPDQKILIEVSLDNGTSFLDDNVTITSKDCPENQASPPDPTADSPHEEPPEQPSEQPSDPSSPSRFTAIINPLYFLILIPALLMFPLLFCCFQYCKREPKTCRIPICPTRIVPCCGCQVNRIRRIEGKMNTLCYFLQSCNQVPMMCCQPRDKRRCINFTLMRPHPRQLPCGPRTYLRCSQGYIPLHNCCSLDKYPPQIYTQPPSRILPLIPPCAWAPCKTNLPLPPP